MRIYPVSHQSSKYMAQSVANYFSWKQHEIAGLALYKGKKNCLPGLLMIINECILCNLFNSLKKKQFCRSYVLDYFLGGNNKLPEISAGCQAVSS